MDGGADLRGGGLLAAAVAGLVGLVRAVRGRRAPVAVVEVVGDVPEELEARADAEEELAGRLAEAEPVLVAWKINKRRLRVSVQVRFPGLMVSLKFVFYLLECQMT